MAVLTSQQRNVLESTVIKARNYAENGARNALHSLSVDEAQPFTHISPEQRALRNRLRSKARLLGDSLPSSGNQQIDHLAYELAYEYWHKMLFAKILEANGLLIHSDGIAVTMEECEELAREEGYADKWDAAATYASKMLPAIFRVNDPLLNIEFATEDRIKLESLLDGLENEIFIADDTLGWVYQYWQSEAKARINASGDKIDGEKLPAVTQLFTEPYMVHFLIDNTVGAWWVSRNPGVTPPVKFEYLRTLENGKPAAGSFEGWPDKAADITSLDPCMGSGHFVVSLFEVFVNLRMYEEGLSKKEATDKVIRENLYGLEIDPRCTQLAAFNLALTAWKFCGKYKELPEMNLACSGIAPKGKKEDWVKLVVKVPDLDLKTRIENGMKMLYDHFQLAPELGSLLDPSTIKSDAFTASFDELQPTLLLALEDEKDTEQLDRGVMAAGIAKAGKILSQKYTLQITNVPYLARGKQDNILAEYCFENYLYSKGDLANVFLEKMLKTTKQFGNTCCVMPQSWLSSTSYKKFRENLLKIKAWSFVSRLGPKCFNTTMWDFNVILICIHNRKPNDKNVFVGLDVSEEINPSAKDEALKTTEIRQLNQYEQLKNPDSRIVFDLITEGTKLTSFAHTGTGVQTFDRPRFILQYWELRKIEAGWLPLQSTPERNKLFSGMDEAIKWQDGNGELFNYIQEKEKAGYKSGIWKAGSQYWGKKGVLHSVVGNLSHTFYLGYPYDTNAAVIIPKDEKDISAIYCFSDSRELYNTVRALDQKLWVTNSTFVKVKFDINKWRRVAEEKYPYGLPKPYSDDPTQWLFHGHPIKADNPLQVAVARFLGYRWPAESDEEMELSDEARYFIDEIKKYNSFKDDDGIVCIPSVNGELTAADRIRNYLQKVFGTDWNNQTINSLLQKEGSRKTNLEEWLREEFFEQHCKVFQNRPFIWHIWDGRKDGFGAFVNYHKLTKENLEKLTYTYLGDWIRQCEAKKKAEESGSEGLLSAALKLKENLEAILLGEQPLDIFVRWKPIEKQPIGWDPDINDGVRLNIRPFVFGDVLRKKPKIKWGIDRGKNPPGSPWGEIRDNDKHLTLAEKKAAREKNKKG